MMEDVAELKGASQPPAMGVGLLAAVQSIPKHAPSSQQPREEKEAAAQPKNELPSYEDADEAEPSPTDKGSGSKAEEPEDALR
jgi:hypothetical protein